MACASTVSRSCRSRSRRSCSARRCGRCSMPADNSLVRVLVVDDQSHVRTWVREILKRMGIDHVTEAEDGREALAAVTKPGAWFDLILCDLQMPERDGIET